MSEKQDQDPLMANIKSVFEAAGKEPDVGLNLLEFNNILRGLEEEPTLDDKANLNLEHLVKYLKEHFIKAFKRWDENGNGVISSEDFKLKGFGADKFQEFVNNLAMDEEETSQINQEEFLLKAFTITEHIVVCRYTI